MQVKPPQEVSAAIKPKKKPQPPGPGLRVAAFVDLMKRLHAHKEQLTDEQVRFVQNAIQRFEAEAEGMVKTKHALPKPKKPKQGRPASPLIESRPPTLAGKGFIERLVKLTDEQEALAEIQHLSDANAERLAREQGLRAPSPDIARQKLAETVVTLREIERIAGAGKRPAATPDCESPQ